MDTMEGNKAIAAVLVAGIAFFVSGTIGVGLVHETRLKEPAIKIAGMPETAAAAAPAPEEIPPIATYLAAANEQDGEAYAKKVCAACHTFGQGQAAGVGPNLYGVVGGPHAHMPGFNYSDAIKSKQGPWTYEELNHWLYKPAAYAQGTRMAFAGIPSEKQRADVIDYLRTLSPNPEPLPAAQPAASTGAGAATQTGSSQGEQPSSSGTPAGQSPTAARAQQTQPGTEQTGGAAAGAGSPAPAASSH